MGYRKNRRQKYAAAKIPTESTPELDSEETSHPPGGLVAPPRPKRVAGAKTTKFPEFGDTRAVVRPVSETIHGAAHTLVCENAQQAGRQREAGLFGLSCLICSTTTTTQVEPHMQRRGEALSVRGLGQLQFQ